MVTVVVIGVVVIAVVVVVTMDEIDVPWRNNEIERKAVVFIALRLPPTGKVTMEIVVTETMIRETCNGIFIDSWRERFYTCLSELQFSMMRPGQTIE